MEVLFWCLVCVMFVFSCGGVEMNVGFWSRYGNGFCFFGGWEVDVFRCCVL